MILVPTARLFRENSVRLGGLVVYAAMSGNTRQVAAAIADGMGDGAEATLVAVADAPDGSPTTPASICRCFPAPPPVPPPE